MIGAVKSFRPLAIVFALLGVACSESIESTPCEPACRAGEICNFGVCTVSCNPVCAFGQQCVISGGRTACVTLDAGPGDASDAASDVALPDVPSVDAPVVDAPPTDVAPMDNAPVDAPPVDVPPTDVTPIDNPPTDTGPMDTGSTDTSPMDTGPTDTGPMDTGPMDTGPMDTGPVDVAMDVMTRPPCGGSGQSCCGFPGSETACRDGLICNATSRGTCVDVTRQAGECVTSATCSTGRVCGGPTGCGERWCYSCQPPGALPFDAVCNPDMQGRDCNSGVCQRGRCTAACSLGAAGDDECARVAAGSRCVAFFYGSNLNDAGVPGRWITLGYCARACARQADCTEGRACVASANLIDDRLDFVCQTTTRPGTTGATCTTGSMCQSGLCVNVGTTAVCMAPCTTDADCPSTYACRAVSLYRPVSGVPYDARGCLPR